VEEKHFGPVWFIPGKNRGRYPFCHSVYIDGAFLFLKEEGLDPHEMKLRPD
jgi:hypothetical protein